jgi:hypothetical protein
MSDARMARVTVSLINLILAGCFSSGASNSPTPETSGPIGGLSADVRGPDLSQRQQARSMLERSKTPLSGGSEGCRFLAKYYANLGELVREYETKHANTENDVNCVPDKTNRSLWRCKAAFVSNNVKNSEELDSSLVITYAVRNGVIESLECFFAG